MDFKNKIIFKIVIAFILIISAGFSTFGAGKIVNTVLRDYVFQVENCRYERPMPVLPVDRNIIEEPVEVCKIDTNRTKRDLADGLSGLIIGGPLAFFAFRTLRKLES